MTSLEHERAKGPAECRVMSDSPRRDGADPPVDDRRADTFERGERRRTARPALSDEAKAADSRALKGACECSNQNCWHFRRCKAPGVAYVAKRSASGALSCQLFCRECARTSGGRAERL